jgi:hypothetical protein
MRGWILYKQSNEEKLKEDYEISRFVETAARGKY